MTVAINSNVNVLKSMSMAWSASNGAWSLRVHHTTIITWLKAVEKLLPDAYTREQIADVGSRR